MKLEIGKITMVIIFYTYNIPYSVDKFKNTNIRIIIYYLVNIIQKKEKFSGPYYCNLSIKYPENKKHTKTSSIQKMYFTRVQFTKLTSENVIYYCTLSKTSI